MSHIDTLILAHVGRNKFCTFREFEDIAGKEDAAKVLEEFGSWERACEYLKNHWGFDLEMPFALGPVPAEIADVLHDFRKVKNPVDFSTVPGGRESLIKCLKNFYDTFGFLPTVDEARERYADYIPDVRHYLETFGTWHNACRAVPGVKAKHVPDFRTELKTTVRYYNAKFGKSPNKLMLKSQWDEMVRKLNKDVPNSSRLIDYVTVDRENRGTGLPQNGWQAVAEAARLEVDMRGRPQELARLNDRHQILKKYVGACIKSGCILSVHGWREYCIVQGRGYRPPNAKTIEEVFGSVENLQKKAAYIIEKYPQHKTRFLAAKEVNREAERNFGTPKEKDIWEKILRLNPETPSDSVEMERRLVM